MFFVYGQDYLVEIYLVRESDCVGGQDGFIVFMSGIIVVCYVDVGVMVDVGDVVIIFEVMKMEYILCVSVVGIVECFYVVVGDSVVEGMLLVDFNLLDFEMEV